MEDREALLVRLKDKANFCRRETIRLINIAKSGHYGSVFSAAEILATLYYHVLRYDPHAPAWSDRDRFILSKGHAAVGLYPLLADVGFFDPALLDTYTRLGSPFGDHPDMRKVPGIDFSSGSLGHGLSVAVGMALAAHVTGRHYRVYALLGDGEMDEGQVWEAAMSASHFKLGNLVAIVDRNHVSVDGDTADVMNIEPLSNKWDAFGWRVLQVDGHDLEALLDCFAGLPHPESVQPTVLIANTVAGKGVSFMEDRFEWHLGYLAPPDQARALADLEGEP